MLPGLRLLNSDVLDKELVLTVGTPRHSVGCPAYGAVARLKDRREVTVRTRGAGCSISTALWSTMKVPRHLALSDATAGSPPGRAAAVENCP